MTRIVILDPVGFAVDCDANLCCATGAGGADEWDVWAQPDVARATANRREAADIFKSANGAALYQPGVKPQVLKSTMREG